MLNTSWHFYFALFGICIVYYVIPKRLQRWLLLLASYAIYSFWNWRFSLILAIVTIVCFWGALQIESKPMRKRVPMAICSICTIGILCIFKYLNFFLDNINQLALFMGIGHTMPLLKLIVPIGLSFYVFQVYGYVLDVNNGKIKAETSLIDFALFVSFFPSITSGPIARAEQLLPQLKNEHSLDWSDISVASRRVLLGLFKKVVVADRLAMVTAWSFDFPDLNTSGTLLLSAYLFTIQIYCDFSGYSDIAIGTARFLGIRLPENFQFPYFATSIRDFWRRWHISLSKWFGDYLYIPLGGNRVSFAKWCCNILFVFLLSGLWHGAHWTFAFWGLLHGVARIVEGGISRIADCLGTPKRIKCILGWFMTINYVSFAWVFFRSASIEKAFSYLSGICSGWHWPSIGASQVIATINLLMVLYLVCIECGLAIGLPSRMPQLAYKNIRFAAYLGMALFLALFGIGGGGFIYFQF